MTPRGHDSRPNSWVPWQSEGPVVTCSGRCQGQGQGQGCARSHGHNPSIECEAMGHLRCYPNQCDHRRSNALTQTALSQLCGALGITTTPGRSTQGQTVVASPCGDPYHRLKYPPTHSANTRLDHITPRGHDSRPNSKVGGNPKVLCYAALMDPGHPDS
jgi:hypothetical protein